MTRTRFLVTLAGALLCGGPALADQFPTSLGGPSNGSVVERRLGTSGTVNVPVDENNPLPVALYGGGTPAPVIQAGSTGTDFSANAATVPMAGLVLLATIPATPGRAFAEVQNQSAATIQIVRDDGAGANQTTILVASGGSAGAQGGGWSSATFKGRIRVYGATGAQVSAYQD